MLKTWAPARCADSGVSTMCAVHVPLGSLMGPTPQQQWTHWRKMKFGVPLAALYMNPLRSIRRFAGTALSASLMERFRLGIGARLGIAVAAGGALVLALNFLVEKVVLIERTTQITQFAPPAPPVSVPVAVPTPAPPVAAAISAPPEPARLILTPDRLLLTLDHFDAAVRTRVAAESEASTAEYQRAVADLTGSLDTFISSATSISGKSYGKLAAAFKLHQHKASALITTSDERHASSAKYAALFETLNARDKASLDHSWKIFGRVVARQSLLQISSDLDALRRRAASFAASDGGTAPNLNALLEAEHAVQKDLDDNQTTLRRTEGEAWYKSMSADLSALVSMRVALMQADTEMGERAQEFSAHTAALLESIPRKIESQPRESARPANSRPIAVATPDLPIPPVETASNAAPLPDAIETHSKVTESLHDDSKRITIAWLCAGLLLVLIFILIGTVLSILRPVRSLLLATTRLARGETNTRVPRGGIKELDAVAVAFNVMCEELSIARTAAQQYQQGLEGKVAERTRQLQYLAENDPLTGLPNRREWFRLLNAAIGRARPDGRQIGVFFLDIDNFKYINDSMGHAFGDRVLVSLSERLQDTARAFGFAARLGGDEFSVVLETDCNAQTVSAAGLAIVQTFQQPLTVDNRELIVNVSVGASIYPEHAQEPDALLKAADVALFRAKSLGRCQMSMFAPELLKEAEAKFSTEQGLRRAIERGEFELVFQPEISVDTLETSLVEALIRWRMPDGTLVLPARFLGIAEESGLILEIGDWVLKAAIEAAAHWHHGAWPEARVAINVSARQFIDAGFIDRLQGLLATHRLPPHCIEIELTESVLQTGPSTLDALRRLRALGVTIALDDFGTGYSSLASLEHLPLSRIKLDRGLLEGIDNSPRSAAIANAIISMCQGLGLQITAEGIERPEQFAMMLKHRGMFLQGYLLGRPTSQDELIPEIAKVSQRAQELLLLSPVRKASNVVDWAKRSTEDLQTPSAVHKL
jgi:diguanylate cyclase (GGDEF)-like protein